MKPLDALDLATTEFAARLALVDPDQWTHRTPCTDWDVSYLVAHVVGGNRFAVSVLAGESSERAIETIMTTPQLGVDPAHDFATTTAEQHRRFAAPGRLEVDHPAGSMTVGRFLSFRVFDIALHAWDLAIAIEADSMLDADLVEAVLATIADCGGEMGFGIEALGDAGPDATAQQRLLDLTGRSQTR